MLTDNFLFSSIYHQIFCYLYWIGCSSWWNIRRNYHSFRSNNYINLLFSSFTIYLLRAVSFVVFPIFSICIIEVLRVIKSYIFIFLFFDNYNKLVILDSLPNTFLWIKYLSIHFYLFLFSNSRLINEYNIKYSIFLTHI